MRELTCFRDERVILEVFIKLGDVLVLAAKRVAPATGVQCPSECTIMCYFALLKMP